MSPALFLASLLFQAPEYDPSIPPSHHSPSPNKQSTALLRWRVAGTFSLRIQNSATKDFHLDFVCATPLIWSSTGTRLLAHHARTNYVRGNECQPAIYDIPSRQRIHTFGIPGTTFALSPDRKSLAYADATQLWIQPLSPDFNPSAPAWRLAQHHLGIDELRWTGDSQRLHYKIPFDDQAAPRVIEVTPGAIPNNSSAPTSSSRKLWALDLSTEFPHLKFYELPHTPAILPRRFNYFIESHQYSPDRRWLAYGLRHRYDNTFSQELFAIPISGGAPIQLSPAGRYFLDFQWSADSRYLLACNPTHTSEGTGLVQIRVIDGRARKLTTNPCDKAHDPPSGFHFYYWEAHRPFIHRIPRSGTKTELYLTTKDRIVAAHGNALFFEQKNAPAFTILRRDLRTHQTTIWYTHKSNHPIKFLRQSGPHLLLFGTAPSPKP